MTSQFISTDEAAHAAGRLGHGGTASVLASERDQTFRLDTPAGQRLVLKICHPDEDPAMIGFQLGAMRHLAAVAPGLPVPQVHGAAPLHYHDGTTRLTALLSWLDGAPLHAHQGGAAQARALGALMARIGLALRAMPAPEPAPYQFWDIANLPDIRPRLAVLDAEVRAAVEPVLAEFAAHTGPALAALPRQVLHNDFNPYNIFVDAADPARITGVIDFGDIAVTARVNDLAIALSYRLPHAALRPTIGPWLAAYDEAWPLSAAERDLLPHLIRARMAMTVTFSAWRARLHPENAAYLLRFHHPARAALAAPAPSFEEMTRWTVT
ncbi:phosphotransferase [Acidocella sp. KAb 2-4]|uniref:phosphotransferase n=1 Tax=Acidocella sp. KAb 2-4 TaxID=2885158 RepID=UPI001D08A7FB|nr:phosphotransferase [Acidocella sp. KAb 2-4]MCB5944417.1 phosphotransferase [Acidocella sp. KAb 2-4]